MFGFNEKYVMVFVGILVLCYLVYRTMFANTPRIGGESDDDIDPIDFDDYDEDIGFEITIDDKTRMFAEASTIWVPSGSEVVLRTTVEPEGMDGELSFKDLTDNQRVEWSFMWGEGSNPADFDTFDDGDLCRIINMDDDKSGTVTVDCMIIDKLNDTRYVASVTIIFTSTQEVPAPQEPLVQLEQA